MFRQGMYLSTDLLYNICKNRLEIIERTPGRVNGKMFFNCLAVGAGGFAGSVFRYIIGLIPWLNKSEMPFQTLIVNVAGAVIIGMLVKSADTAVLLDGRFMLFLKVGICGGFTTFSTFSLESLELLEMGKPGIFAVYVIASIVLCILGVFCGKYIAGALQ